MNPATKHRQDATSSSESIGIIPVEPLGESDGKDSLTIVLGDPQCWGASPVSLDSHPMLRVLFGFLADVMRGSTRRCKRFAGVECDATVAATSPSSTSNPSWCRQEIWR